MNEMHKVVGLLVAVALFLMAVQRAVTAGQGVVKAVRKF